MKRHISPFPSDKSAKAQTGRQDSDKTLPCRAAGQQAAAPRRASKAKTAVATDRHDMDFAVHIIGAAEAGPLLNETQRLYLRPDSLVFFLCREQEAINIAVFGFCIVHNKREQKPTINSGAAAAIINRAGGETAARPVPVLRFAAENIVKTHQGKNFLEIALFHIADKRKTPRAKHYYCAPWLIIAEKSRLIIFSGSFHLRANIPLPMRANFLISTTIIR